MGIGQMIFFEEQLWRTASAITTTNICLTKDKNIIGALITASIWEIILKNMS